MFLPTNITLKFGDSGDFVTELQRRLSLVKCFEEGNINGFFDGVTVNGVSQFQSMSGIRADGIAGPETLRRLNGSISGDYSDADRQADEAARQQEEANRILLQQQALLREQEAAQLREQQAQQQQSYEAERQATPPPPPPAATIASPPAPIPASAGETLSAMLLAPQTTAPQLPLPTHPAPPTATAGDALANMLLAPQQALQPPAPLQAHTQSTPVHITPQPALTAPSPRQLAATEQQLQPPAAPVVAAVPPAPMLAPTHTAASVPAAEAPARGMIGRAVQYANEMVQKLANYFESKLPNHVITEVKELGQVMAKSGVREISIPTAPEPQRSMETPARAPQPQQAAQLPPRN